MHRIFNLTQILALLSNMIVQLAGAEVPLQQVYDSSHPAWINCISEDPYTKAAGFLLVCEDHRLMSFNYGQHDNPQVDNDEVKQLIVGARSYGYGEGVGLNAFFRLITDVAHLDSDTEVVVDQQNHCLRTVDRFLNRTSPFVGRCTTAGSADGSFKDARFDFPYRMSKLGDYLYVTGWTNSAIRIVDLIKSEVSTLSTARFIKNPSGIAIVENYPVVIYGYGIWITFENGIAEYSVDTDITLLRAAGDISADSSNQATKHAFDSPRDIASLPGNRFLIADRDNGRVKLLDIDQKTVTLMTSSAPTVTRVDLVDGVAFIGCRKNTVGYIYTFDPPVYVTSTPATSRPTTSTPTTRTPTTSMPNTNSLTTSTPTANIPTTSAPTTSAPTTILSANNQQPAQQVAAIVRVLLCSVQLLLLVLI